MVIGKNKFFILSLMVIVLCINTVSSQAYPSSSNHSTEISLYHSTDQGLEFTLQVPWQTLQIQDVVIGNESYTGISIPGWPVMTDPGYPAVPFWQSVIGVPFGAEISLEITPGKSHIIELPSLPLPAGKQSVIHSDQVPEIWGEGLVQTELSVEPDAEIYGSKNIFPASFEEMTSDSVLRQQRVVGIGVYPIQYHPDQNQLVIYETVNVRVNFSSQLLDLEREPNPESPVYDSVFKDLLLNEEQAREWRISSPADLEGFDQVDTDSKYLVPIRSSWSPPEPGWRISIPQAGIYEITYSELSAAGLPVETIDANTFQMFHQGEEIAIEITGDLDQIFENGESIIFYGLDHQTKYSDTNVYWLTYGSANGLRMTERDVTPEAASTAGSFIRTKTMEENHYYYSAVPGDDDFDRFMWDFIRANNSEPAQWTHTFELIKPLDGSGEIAIDLLGYIQRPVDPDHHVIVTLENAIIGTQQIAEVFWDGIAWQNLVVEIPPGYFADGENRIVIKSVNDTGGVYDRIFVDKIEVNYSGLFSAEQNQLAFHFTKPGDWIYEIDGFLTASQSIFDVTNPNRVVRLMNHQVSGSTDYLVRFQDNLTEPKDYFVSGEEKFQSVSSITLDHPSNLQFTSRQIDYILITPEEFSDQAQVLVDHRQSQGLQAIRVELQDIYDEFNFGLADANAIHDFLQFAYENWQAPAPSFVVLLGDGHYDPNNNLGYGRTSYIPAFMAVVDPWIKETASDNRYVTISGNDTLPDMMIGRLSVNSSIEAEIFINKIIAYETSPEPGDWQQKILAIADNADSGGSFPSFSESILNEFVPEAFTVDKVYYGLSHITPESARAAIQSSFNSGALFINYIGHAYYTGWAYEDLFTTGDVPLLENGSKLPIVLAMTCYEGLFQRPNPLGTGVEALAEVVTNAQGRGAVASFSPTGLGVASGHDALNRGFLDAFFNQKVETIGEAILEGKLALWSTGSNLDLLDTYMLFGDPATKFSKPFQANDDLYQTDEDTPLQVNSENGLMVNDDYAYDSQPIVEIVESVQFGTLDLKPSGIFSYEPDQDWFGAVQFTYRLIDGDNVSNSATVRILVEPVNDPPVAFDQTISTGFQTPVEIKLTATDIETGLLSYDIIDGERPEHGSLGSVDLPKLTYLPNTGFYGSDSFTFIANDGELDSEPATITIVVGSMIYFPIFSR